LLTSEADLLSPRLWTAYAPSMSVSERAELRRLFRLAQQKTPAIWNPLPGPQTTAFYSEADEVYYGGAAGGGKTDLELGLAATEHYRSIIFRREYKQLSAIIERSKELLNPIKTFNEQKLLWRLPGGRQIEFAAVQHEDDKLNFQGRPHDLYAFDELPQFTETQYRFIIGWARSTRPGQRVRILGAGNPPTSAEGEWVIMRWGAWLDEQHPNPAEPGELRWYATIDQEEREVEGPERFEYKGELVIPRSRTFVPARLDDNPYLAADGRYLSVIQGMPEPLRTQLLYGDHSIGLGEDAWQVIPTAWIREAQARWKPDGWPTDDNDTPLPVEQLGVDIAQGGRDRTVLARRIGDWYAEPEVHPGPETPDARVAADLLARALLDGGVAEIDADGIGISTYLLCKAEDQQVLSYMGSKPTEQRDRSGRIRFVNVRAAAWWKFREKLDPAHGSEVALPPGRAVRVELAAPRYTIKPNGIQLEKKEDIKARLGYSPDIGDAIVQASYEDPAGWMAAVMGQHAPLRQVTRQSKTERELDKAFGIKRPASVPASANGRRRGRR
jgi:hypothetical protein